MTSDQYTLYLQELQPSLFHTELLFFAVLIPNDPFLPRGCISPTDPVLPGCSLRHADDLRLSFLVARAPPSTGPRAMVIGLAGKSANPNGFGSAPDAIHESQKRCHVQDLPMPSSVS
ncbi:hypothetical protein AVEN_218543-1 [Araneus ventricosus]|uniref:Uncharacterized protein n=1 Tax=Araneus ventricosus TaxID=182803 RepID=A0A4Y2RAX8_ARAVE|nr:hypothetical protein AVEN_218543-1 [Araneus ventricosus]